MVTLNFDVALKSHDVPHLLHVYDYSFIRLDQLNGKKTCDNSASDIHLLG